MVTRNTLPEWNETATRAVCALAATARQFTVDEVWQLLGDDLPLDTKALGGLMTSMSNRWGMNVIAPAAGWCMSVRKQDRPIRYWVGTGKPHPRIEPPTADEIVAALKAIGDVDAKRGEMLAESMRRIREHTAS